MSSWRVERHYGFGAAQISICPEAHRSSRPRMVEGFGVVVAELTSGGVRATLRGLMAGVPAILLGLLLFVAFAVTLTRDRADFSPIEVVLFETPAALPIPVQEPVPEPIVEELIPVPVEIAMPEPVKPVKPIEPPPQKLAERPKPPPPIIEPLRPPKPKARPKPVMPQIAKIEVPRPSPAVPIKRAKRALPQPMTRQRVEIDASRSQALAAAPVPRLDRMARNTIDRTAPTRVTPRMDVPAAPALERLDEAPAQRAFRVASAKPSRGNRVRPALASNAVSATAFVKPSSVPNRPAVRHTRSAPQVVARRAARPSPVTRGSGTISIPQPASLAAVSRAGRAAPAVPRGSNSGRPGVAGVPLGDLAACLSDREEDRLKQAVVAAVTTQNECVSSKGTYRFIETKNLNAFLMWIDRAPSRGLSDRCEELGYALECLEGASRQAAR